MTRVYYKEAAGAAILFDMSRSSTFENAQKWKTDLNTKLQLADGKPIPCVLIGNKCDIEKDERMKDPKTIDDFCQKNNFSGWYEASAKTGVNVNEAMHFLVKNVMAVHRAGKYEVPVISQNDQTYRIDNDGGAFMRNGTAKNGAGRSVGKNCSC